MVVILIERRAGGSLVVSTKPPLPHVRKTYLTPFDRNKRFSRAAGYAATLAAQFGWQLEDRTGRLSAAECAQLVAAVALGE